MLVSARACARGGRKKRYNLTVVPWPEVFNCNERSDRKFNPSGRSFEHCCERQKALRGDGAAGAGEPVRLLGALAKPPPPLRPPLPKQNQQNQHGLQSPPQLPPPALPLPEHMRVKASRGAGLAGTVVHWPRPAAAGATSGPARAAAAPTVLVEWDMGGLSEVPVAELRPFGFELRYSPLHTDAWSRERGVVGSSAA